MCKLHQDIFITRRIFQISNFLIIPLVTEKYLRKKNKKQNKTKQNFDREFKKVRAHLLVRTISLTNNGNSDTKHNSATMEITRKHDQSTTNSFYSVFFVVSCLSIFCLSMIRIITIITG
jgi:hypothetical protein